LIVVDDLKVVDVDVALNLIDGNEQIYLKVIDVFLDNQSHIVEEIEMLLENNINEARIPVHSCKGISKNIGSIQLFEVSESLEEAIISQNHESISNYFDQFKIIFSQLLNELNQIKELNN